MSQTNPSLPPVEVENPFVVGGLFAVEVESPFDTHLACLISTQKVVAAWLCQIDQNSMTQPILEIVDTFQIKVIAALSYVGRLDVSPGRNIPQTLTEVDNLVGDIMAEYHQILAANH